MNWLEIINQAVRFCENNLTENISIDDVSSSVNTSSSHFQRIFNLVTGITVGDYIRFRRLSEAGKDLKNGNSKVIDIAFKYQYDTPESFSKAFYRFHGMNPSVVSKNISNLKYYSPITINVYIQGGYNMASELINDFYWSDLKEAEGKNLSDKEKYDLVCDWAVKARCNNPLIFDNLTEWILDDNEWTIDKIKENEQILMISILGRFKEQDLMLRTFLKQIKTKGIVNEAVFNALDTFDQELLGFTHDKKLKEAVKTMFNDFKQMVNRDLRLLIAGEKTGASGTDGVEIFGYINYLKECDAGVQWALFMPESVKRQQKGFKVETFELKSYDGFRFIGFEAKENEDNHVEEKMKLLDSLNEYKDEYSYDIFLMHHKGQNVDKGRMHAYFGRFYKPNTNVPNGFISIDFTSEFVDVLGEPFVSQFALATFSGDPKAMYSHDGYDCNGLYDVTRNIILGQGLCIPYPAKYWNAEVYLEGFSKPSTAYMFSVIKD